MNSPAHAASPAAFGSQGRSVARFRSAPWASCSAAVCRTSASCTATSPARRNVKAPSLSDGNLSAGLLSSPSRSCTVLLYSRLVRRRSGIWPTASAAPAAPGSGSPSPGATSGSSTAPGPLLPPCPLAAPVSLTVPTQPSWTSSVSAPTQAIERLGSFMMVCPGPTVTSSGRTGSRPPVTGSPRGGRRWPGRRTTPRRPGGWPRWPGRRSRRRRWSCTRTWARWPCP